MSDFLAKAFGGMGIKKASGPERWSPMHGFPGGN